MSMCISIAQAPTSLRPALLVSKGLVLLARCARFLSYDHFVWQPGTSGAFWNLARDRCRTWVSFSPVWQAWLFFSHVAKPLAVNGSKWEVLLEVIFRGRHKIWWPWTTFWKGRVESLVLWNRRRVWYWTWWWLQLPRAHFLWRAQYFVDLDKKVAET